MAKKNRKYFVGRLKKGNFAPAYKNIAYQK